MRINKFIAQATSLSRRSADTAIEQGRVMLNGKLPGQGAQVEPGDTVIVDGKVVSADVAITTIMLNKPVGYVCSREGQGSKTIYELLPEQYQSLKSIGRLDKYSSGLLLLTNDGNLANELTHPRYDKKKIYEITLNVPLPPLQQQMINDYGVQLPDGPSKLQLEKWTTKGELGE